jgi:hypothetical protein
MTLLLIRNGYQSMYATRAFEKRKQDFAVYPLTMENQALIVFICLIAGLVYGIKKAKSEISPKRKVLTVFLYPFAAYMLAILL